MKRASWETKMRRGATQRDAARICKRQREKEQQVQRLSAEHVEGFKFITTQKLQEWIDESTGLHFFKVLFKNST